jgi:hypothetical protein
VTAPPSSDFALIVDNDLGFLMWLGELLSELGCQAVPALHCRQALHLSKRFELPITILLLDPELPGAARMVKLLTTANPGVRVALIRNSNLDRVDSTSIRSCCTVERPSPGEPISRPEWLAKIRNVLRA